MGRVLRVMVCSPSDVSDERAAIVQIIHRWTADNLIDEDVILAPVLWEDMLPQTVEGKDGQTSINEMMTHKADIFIGVFKHRFGVEARAGAEVGTVEEIMIALRAKKPLHLFFYNGTDQIDSNNGAAAAQLAKVHDFKNRMQGHGIYAIYREEYQLREDVSRVLNNDVRQFIRENPRPELTDSTVPGAIASEDEIPKNKPKPSISKSWDGQSDAPPVSGSTVVYSTHTDVTTDNTALTTPNVRPAKTGIPTRPQSSSHSPGNAGLSVNADGSYYSPRSEEPSIYKNHLPTHPQRSKQDGPSPEQQEKLRHEQNLATKRDLKRSRYDDLNLNEYEVDEVTMEMRPKGSSRHFEETGALPLSQSETDKQQRVRESKIAAGRKFVDENIWRSDESRKLSPTDLKNKTSAEIAEITKRDPALARQMKMYPNGFNPDLDESVARWNSNEPLRASSNVGEHKYEDKNWTIYENRGRKGTLAGLSVLQIGNEQREHINIEITDSEGSSIPFKYQSLDGYKVDSPLQIAVTFANLVRAAVIYVRITWNVETSRFLQETNLAIAAGTRRVYVKGSW